MNNTFLATKDIKMLKLTTQTRREALYLQAKKS